MSVLELWIVHLHSSYCSQGRLSQKKNGHARLCSYRIQSYRIQYLEKLVETIIMPARQNQFFQGIIFNNAPIRRVAIAMNTNSAFIGSCTENPFWCQQFDLRQIRILRSGQPFVDLDTADNFCLYMTTMKAMDF